MAIDAVGKSLERILGSDLYIYGDSSLERESKKEQEFQEEEFEKKPGQRKKDAIYISVLPKYCNVRREVSKPSSFNWHIHKPCLLTT